MSIAARVIRTTAAALAFGMLPAAVALAADVERDGPVLQVEFGQHAAPIRRLAVDPAQTLVVTASDDKTARVWDLGSGQLRRVLRPPIGQDSAGKLYGASVHPGGKTVAVAGSTGDSQAGHAIYLFDLDSGAVRQRIAARAGHAKRLQWTGDGSLLLAVFDGDHGLRAYDANGSVVFEDRYAGASYGLSVSPSGLTATVARDGKLRLYRATGTRLVVERLWSTSHSAPVSVALSPDGGRAAVGYSNPGAPAEIIDLASGTVVHRLSTPQFSPRESLGAVAWSTDGKTVFVGGRAAVGTLDFYVATFDAVSGRQVEQRITSRDSITDLAPLRDGGFAYASFDATWGIVRAGSAERVSTPSIVGDLRGAAHLVVSPDARRVGWAFDSGRDPAWFSFETRRVQAGRPDDLHAAQTKSGLFDNGAADWENHPRPRVNGAVVTLEAGELARAVAMVQASKAAFLATSWALYRIGPRGEVQWRRSVASEARAVNASVDGKLLVTAMADGTIRWWRGSDGHALLTLLPMRDKRWILWTPNGFFTAGPGADRLAGWHVNRGLGNAADFYPLARFADEFDRSDVLERVLDLADVGEAWRRAEADRQSALSAVRPEGTSSSAAAQVATARPDAGLPTISVLALPPVLRPLGSTALTATAGGRIDLPFELRSEPTGGVPELEVRIDGRPAPVLSVQLDLQSGGTSPGKVTVAAPESASLIQVLARDRFGFSEAIEIAFQPAPRPPKPAAVASVSAASEGASARGAKLFLLAIGVSEYRRNDYKLEFPAKDAEDFTRMMTRQKGKVYADAQVRVLTNAQATKSAIETQLKWLAKSVGRDDTGVLFLAGHGINSSGGRYFFIPHDGEHERVEATSVSETAIRDALRSIAGKALFFVDTCHAGNVVGSLGRANGELARLANSLAATENGVVVFASSTGTQLSEERDEWRNGAFTKALLDGLAGQADFKRRGQVTFKGLDFYVADAVPRLTNGRQTPVTIVPVGVPDFPLAVVQP